MSQTATTADRSEAMPRPARARTCSSPAAAPASARRSPCASPSTAPTSRSTTCASPTRRPTPRSRCTPASHKVQQEGVRDVLVQGDVSKEDDVVRMVGEAVDGARRHRRARQQRRHPDLAALATSSRSADFDKVLAVNLRGVVPVRARGDQALPRRRTSRGSIVNVSSVHQLIPKPDYLGYSVSKGGMQNLTRTLALEYAGRGIRVNGIGPGATVTPINRAWIDDPGQDASRSRSHIPMRARRHGRRDGRRRVLPRQRRRRLHHRPDDLRRRRPDPVPELPRALVVGVSDAAPRRWWPSPFGEDDQLGMLNHVDDAKRLAALALVREGRLYDLGRVLDENVPGLPRPLLPPDARHDGAPRERAAGVGRQRRQLDHRAVVSAHDAARHAPRRALPPADRRPRLQRLDASRELAGAAGRDAARRRDGPADRHPRLARRRPAATSGPATSSASTTSPASTPEPGDAVLFHTGWGAHWDDPDALPRRASPAPGCELAEWLAERGVALTGCDTWSYGPVPAEDPDAAVRGARRSSTSATASSSSRTSTPSALAADGVREFALILTHPKLRGATGAWTSPIALV